MADPVAPVVTPAPAPAAAPAPVVAAPAVVPSPAVEAAPSVVPVAADGAAAPVEAPAVAPAEAAPATVIGEAMAKPAEAPGEVKPAETPKPAEGAQPDGDVKPEGQSAEPAPPPVYEPFTVPEGVTLQAERLGEFTHMLGEFEAFTKADHAAVQALGQKLVERHVAEVRQAMTTLESSWKSAWDQQKVTWKEQFLADPEIGGNRFHTTVDSALTFIRTHGGTEAQQTEFRQLMETSGLGNHPAMIRLLAKAGVAMSEGRPVPASAPVPQAKSKVQTMYGGKAS